MKILFIGNKYKRGEPQRGVNCGYHNFYDALVNMNNRSNEVFFFGVDELFISGLRRNQVEEKLFGVIAEKKPNLVFFDEGDLTREAMKKMKEVAEQNGAITCFWVSDDHWMFDMVSKHIAPYFHWVVTTDSQAPPKYIKNGYKNIIHSQWACNHSYYKPLNLPKIYDVTFVGQPHGKRRQMIEKIQKAGINIRCWGYGWPAGVLAQDDMLKVFSQSKINLNFSMSSGVLWKLVASIFLKRRGERDRTIIVDNPLHWLDNFRSVLGSFRTQIKVRHFEIMGSGGFCLTDNADNLKDYYEIGKEVVVFDGIEDCVEKIKYYLAHDEERERIRLAGYQRTLRDHTYEKRFNELFKIMGLTDRSN